ncbi:MAG: hypothetical protein CM15mP68_4430 [Pseudomonadota bacterium]|nr:MAG: hypothetical protein CM15mP68_4430 [Pseudomonadota bacterium]
MLWPHVRLGEILAFDEVGAVMLMQHGNQRVVGQRRDDAAATDGLIGGQGHCQWRHDWRFSVTAVLQWRISDLPELRFQPMAGQAVSGIRRRCQERSSRPKAWQRFERFSVFAT